MEIYLLKAFLGTHGLAEMELAIHEKMSGLVPHLNEREARVISLRFGIGPFIKPHTLAEVSGKMGYTRELIRRIEKEALLKLLKDIGPEIIRCVEQALRTHSEELNRKR